jgi:hydrogenase/urease accessory protein HupE
MGALTTVLAAGRVHAHGFDPALLLLTERDGGTFDVVWRTSESRNPPGRTVADDPLVPRLPASCRLVFPDAPPPAVAGEPVFWRVACEGGLRGATLASTGEDPTRADVIVRVAWRDGPPFTGVLPSGAHSLELPHDAASAFGTSPAALAWGYGLLGVRHILEGLDHLLFVLGLFLLAGSTAELVRTVTAFTVAHSLSLALAAGRVVTLPAAPVEALIAASIVLVAREVAVAPGSRPARPWVLAFAFGLVHGLGFAGALAEIGLPRAHAALALLAFNLGVEVGQLAFVGLLFLVAIPFRRVVQHMPRLRLVPAYAMGTLAVVWVIERVQAFWIPRT